MQGKVITALLLASSLQGAYDHCVQITFSSHPSATLTNFVDLVCANVVSPCDSVAHTNLALPNLKSTVNGGAVTSSSGYDIGVFTDSGCTTATSYSLEYYSPTTGALLMRTLTASKSSSVDTLRYLGFGNSAITTNQSTSATWPSEYIARWSFPNGSSLTTLDSTSNAHNGTITGGVTATTGQLNGAAAFNGSTGYITATISTSVGDLATWSCWVYPAISGSGMFIMRAVNDTGPFLYRNSDSTIWSAEAPFAAAKKTIETVPINTWSMVTMTSANNTGTVQKIYINGVEATYSDLGGGGAGLGPVTSIYFGAEQDLSLKWNGSLDECLWTNVIEPAAWVAAKYLAETAPETNFSFGTDTPIVPLVTHIRGLVTTRGLNTLR